MLFRHGRLAVSPRLLRLGARAAGVLALVVLDTRPLRAILGAEYADLLRLDTRAGLLKGGDTGPAIVPGKGTESLLLKLAAHQDEPLMPPPDNHIE